MLNCETAVVDGANLTPRLASELSALFSASYGTWSAKSPVNPGGPIRLSPAYYTRCYRKAGYKIATCRLEGRLVAEAVYLERATSRGSVALVVQLVVDGAFRRRGVATALLHAVWGFSDFYAWGIVTSNPCTVEALEAATFRRCEAVKIAGKAAFLKEEVLAQVPFLANATWASDASRSVAATGFFTDRRRRPLARRRVEARLGRLPEGSEWLAFTFRDQELDAFDAYSQVVDCSGRLVAEAYRRMPQESQKWASRTREEVDRLLRWLPDLDRHATVCDFGAGCGRHISELRRRGFRSVEGIDFAATDGGANDVRRADCRSWRSNRRYALILCLYDVIGSFADSRGNLAILKNIARHLDRGGYAAISVANANFGSAANIPSVASGNRAALVKAVFRMKPSRVMSTTGEFFAADGCLRDPEKGLYYHKEQFAEGGALPGEYLVVDRRYRVGEIEELVRQAGLVVVRREFVRAGFEPRAEADGKEILILAKKGVSSPEHLKGKRK